MKKLYRKIPGLLIQGILALLPLIITLYTAIFVIRFFENLIDGLIPFFPDFVKENTFLLIGIEAVLAVILLVLILLFGLVTRSVIGKTFLKWMQSFFLYIPGLSAVYKASEQVISVLAQDKQPFYSNPVLVEYPSAGMWVIAFNTGEVDFREFSDGLKRFSVFIPTTPNPTSGFLVIITEDRMKKINISTEDVLKFVLTGGIIKAGEYPGNFSDTEKEKNN